MKNKSFLKGINLKEICDVLIIGTGLAGLATGIFLKEAGLNVLAITKNSDIRESNTFYAQGGIVAYKKDDSEKALARDIKIAGNNYNNNEAVDMFVKEAPKLVFDFLIKKIGMKFQR